MIAAAREGYWTVLVPRGQVRTPKWDLDQLAQTLKITVIEVGDIAEAYQQFTGVRLTP